MYSFVEMNPTRVVTMLLMVLSPSSATADQSLRGQTFEIRALMHGGQCISDTLESCLSVGARCDIFDRLYADEDCRYEYTDWHEYLCPCEEFACLQQEDFVSASKYCGDFLESACPNTVQQCTKYVQQCCEFPTLCPQNAQDGKLELFAKYDWQGEDATDSSGSSIQHDGTLERKASVRDNYLAVREYDGVTLGEMPELDGAMNILLRFEDVTFYGPEQESSYAVLAGGGSRTWWVGVDTGFRETSLKFNIGGRKGWSEDMPFHEHRVKVADEVVIHFDSIEYSFNGTAPSGERLAIRYNDGAWTTGGWSNDEDFRSFPYSYSVHINDGSRADWDEMEAELGPIYFYSSRTDFYSSS